MWIPESNYRGISDKEVISLANRSKRVVLTRDSDFLDPSLRSGARYANIYVGEPIRRDNTEKLARNILKTLEIIEKQVLVRVRSNTIETYLLTS